MQDEWLETCRRGHNENESQTLETNLGQREVCLNYQEGSGSICVEMMMKIIVVLSTFIDLLAF